MRNRSLALGECVSITDAIYENKKLTRELWRRLEEYKDCENELRSIESLTYSLLSVYSSQKSR